MARRIRRSVSCVTLLTLLLFQFSPLISPVRAENSTRPVYDTQPAPLPGPFASLPLAELPYQGSGTYGFQHAIYPWPEDLGIDWVAYTYEGQGPQDPRFQDPSNGGTSPQNYANVSSSCLFTQTDQVLPSISYVYDGGTDTFYFRWRVAQRAHTYATGPHPGSYSSSDPWNSALWTVFFDINGDGWRDFAVHIDGSSGSPGVPIDEIHVIYGSDQSQSLDYFNDPNVHLIGTQNTAVYDTATDHLMNFESDPASADWPNGAAESNWDYGATRAYDISTPDCEEYLIYYQFPLALLDATSIGGPEVTPTTPIALSFATANSLNDPMQKDAVFQGNFTADPNSEFPFGDLITPITGTVQPPTVLDATAIGCGPVELSALVADAHDVVSGTNTVTTTVEQVWFEYWHDLDADGLADEAGGSWTHAVTATLTSGTLSEWTAVWDNTDLYRGAYLLRVVARDSDGNVRYSDDSANLGGVITLSSNTCGLRPPSIAKSVSPAAVTAGGIATYTLTLSNTLAADFTVEMITDTLPAGFAFGATVGGTLAPTTWPAPGATGTVHWTFTPPATVLSGTTATLVYTVTASSVAGTYANQATARTSTQLNPDTASAVIDVGAPALSLAKAVTPSAAAPGDLLTYTLTYGNDSSVGVHNVVVSDAIPAGTTFVAAGGGGALVGDAVVWNVGDLAAGDTGRTLTFTVQIDDPYLGGNPLANVATIAADEAPPAESNRTYTFVSGPNLVLSKSVWPIVASPGDVVTYTITYGNNGDAAATGVVITDVIPTGMSYVTGSATNGGAYLAAQTMVSWTIGTLPAGTTGQMVQFAARVDPDYTGPSEIWNTANATADNTAPLIGEANVAVNVYLGTPYIRISKSADKAVYNTTETPRTVTFTVRLENSGSYTGSVSHVVDELDTGAFTYQAGSSTIGGAPVGDPASSLVGSTNLMTWTIPSALQAIGPDGALTLTYQATVTDLAGLYTNSARAIGYLISNEITGTSALAQAAVTVSDVLVIFNKAVDRNTAAVGDRLTYVINFANNDTKDLVQADMYDPIPPNTAYVVGSFSITNPPLGSIFFSNDSGATYTYTPVGAPGDVDPSVTDILVEIGPGNPNKLTAGVSGSFSFQVEILTETTVITNASVLQSNSATYNGPSNVVTTTILPPPPGSVDLVIQKGASTNPVELGVPFTYTVDYANVGGSDAHDAVLTDTLPAGVTFLSASAGCSEAGGTVTCTLGPIPANGGSGTITISVVANSAGSDQLVNTASLASTGFDTPVTSTYTGTVTRPDLRLSKSAAPTTLRPGDTAVYTLTVLNAGTASATGVLITDAIPATGYYAYVPGSIAGGVARDDTNLPTLAWTLGTLAPGDSAQVSFAMVVGAAGLPAGLTTLENTGYVSATQYAEGVPSNPAPVTLNANPYLELSKSIAYHELFTVDAVVDAATLDVSGGAPPYVGQILLIGGTLNRVTAVSSLGGGSYRITLASSTTVAVGQPLNSDTVTYTLHYTNSGAAEATDVTLSDRLPAGLNYVAGSLRLNGASLTDLADADAGRYDVGSATAHWDVGSLPSAGSGAAALRAQIVTPLPTTGPQSLRNTGAIAATNAAGSQAEHELTVSGAPAFTLHKAGPAVVALDGATARITYTLSYRNTGLVAATGVVITDTLAAGLTFVSASGGGTHNAGVVTWNLGTVGVGASGQVQLVVEAAGSGIYANSALVGAAELPTPTPSNDVETQVGAPVLGKRTLTPALANDTDGTSATYVITLYNPLAAPILNVAITDTLASGFTYSETLAISPDAAGLITRTATSNPAAGSAVPTWGTWSIGPGAELAITFTTRIAAYVGPATYQNALSASGDVAFIPFDELETTAEDVRILLPIPQLTKTVTPATVQATEPVTYTIVAYNTGDAPAEGLVITDTLPSGFTYAADVAIQEQNATRTGVLAPTAGDTSPAWGTWTLQPTGRVTLTFRAATGSATGTFYNNVAVGATNTTAPPLVGVAPVTVTSASQADLSLAKQISDPTPQVGATVIFTVTIANAGPASANGVQAVDQLPSGYSYVSHSAGQGSYTPATGLWDVGSLNSGASADLTITAQVNPGGDYTNVAQVTASDQVDPDSTPGDGAGDDYDDVTPTITPVADLVLSKDVSDPAPGVGDRLTYTLRVTNTGPSLATGVVVTDALPTGLTFVSATASQGTCTESAGLITCAIGNLADGASVTIAIVAEVATDVGQIMAQSLGPVWNGGLKALASPVRVEERHAASTAEEDLPETTTDATGAYRFEGLPHGSHRVTIDLATLPAGLRPAAGTEAPVVWVSPGVSAKSQRLPNGVRFTAHYDAENGDISGAVFVDADGDGVQDPGERGLPNVRVIDPTAHQYFVPFNDTNLWAMFDAKLVCHGGNHIDGVLDSSIFLVSSYDGTVYYYDHWEDGYDPDPLFPSAGSTEVGVLDAGAVKVFQSDITLGAIGGAPPYLYDGRDRITVYGEKATLVRMVYPSSPGVVLASAWEISEVADWGTGFVTVLGEDLDFNGGGNADDADFAGIEVLAGYPDTHVYYDGAWVATLDAGETYFINGANDGAGGGGVDSTDRITTTQPAQVQMLVGGCGAANSGNGHSLEALTNWDTEYWSPVPGFSCVGYDSDIYLHNPSDATIEVTATSNLGTVVMPIPAHTTRSLLDHARDAQNWEDISSGASGVHLKGNGAFWGVGVVDSATDGSGASNTYDWSFSLVPLSELSSQAVVGYAPGTQTPSTGNNANSAFVTAITNTVLYVDLNQDGLPDPFDMNGDGDASDNNSFGVAAWDEPLSALGVPLSAGQALRVGDPNDQNLEGALIYTKNYQEKIAVAWGQDLCRAGTGNPYLDLGYTIYPLPVPTLSKDDSLAVDADLTGDVSPGDTITYTLLLNNNGLGSMNDVVLTDTLPYTYTDFLVGSLEISTPPTGAVTEYFDGATWGSTPIADAHAFRITWPTLAARQEVTITFRVQLHVNIPLTVTEITNQAVVKSDNTDPRWSEDPEDPTDPDTDTPIGRALLAIDKQASTETVSPGERVTYTLAVTNQGTGIALNMSISDLLPEGLRYVPDTMEISWPIAEMTTLSRTVQRDYLFEGYYADDFDPSGGYTGNDGAAGWIWNTSWSEAGDDGSAASGEIRTGTTSANALSDPAYLEVTDADGDVAGATRQADLTDFVAPLLRYYVSGSSAGQYRIEADGTSLLSESYTGAYAIREQDLTAYAGGVTTLGILGLGDMGAGEYYRFDNVAIYESSPNRTAMETLFWRDVVLVYHSLSGQNPASYDLLNNRVVFTDNVRLPAGGTLRITYQAQVDSPIQAGARLTNTAEVTATNWLMLTNPATDTATVQVMGDADLGLVKSDLQDPLYPGDLLTYTITVTNSGPSTAPGVVITDTLPDGVTFVTATISPPALRTVPLLNVATASSAVADPTPSDNTAGATTVVQLPLYDRSCGEAGGLVTCDAGDVGNGESVLVTVVVRIDLDTVGLITNTAVVTGTLPDPTPGDNGDPEETLVLGRADLSLVKVASDPTPDVGDTIHFTVTLTNSGPSTATGVVVEDQLLSGYTYVGHSAGQGSYTPATGVWDVGSVVAGASVDLVITATVNATGDYTNVAEVTFAHEEDPDSTPGDSTGDDYAEIAPVPVRIADLELSKNSTPNPYVAGSPITYTIVVTNHGLNALTSVTLTDNLPAAIQAPAYTPSAGTYDPATGVWSGLALDPGRRITLTIVGTVQAGHVGNLQNTAIVTPTGATDPTPGDARDTDGNPLDPIADLSLTKVASELTPSVGSTLHFTVTLSNSGPSTATGVVVQDQLPSGYAYVNHSAGQGNYAPATGVWNVGVLAAGVSTELVITATVNATGDYANVAEVTIVNEDDPDSTPGDGAGDDYAEIAPTPTPSADLSLTKVASETAPDVGDTLRFTVTLSNNGPSAATGVAVEDQLLSGYTYVGHSAGQGSYTPATGVWDVGSVVAGASVDLVITATVNATGDYTNVAEVTATNEDDPNSTPGDGAGDDYDSSTPAPNAVADLSLTKVASELTPSVGSTLHFTVTLSNSGPSTATGVVVQDQLPSGYAYVNHSAGQGNYAPATGLWDVGTLAAGASVELVITATVNATGDYTNVAEVTATNEDDPDSTPGDGTGDDYDSSTPAPNAVADLSLTKSSRPVPAVPGEAITYTLVVANAGPSTVAAVTVSERLPTAIVSVTYSASDGVYDPASGHWAPLTLDAGEQITLTITGVVDPAFTGTLHNTAVVTPSGATDPDPGDNTGGDDNPTDPRADLSIVKESAAGLVAEGDLITYSLTVVNAGPSLAESARVTDTLPNGLLPIAATPPYSISGATVSWALGALGVNERRTLTLTALVSTTESITNVAIVGSPTGDPAPGNNEDDFTITPLACPITADPTEPDNLYTEAPTIETDGRLYTRTFHTMADKDWVHFYALPGKVYTITTSRLAADVDTVLQLYASDGVTLIEENDDAGLDPGNPNGASQIVWTAPEGGWYYARVTHFDPTYDPRNSELCGNYYEISVEMALCRVPTDATEPDNLYTEAAPIATDGVPLTRTFHTMADKDWVKFYALAGEVYTIRTYGLMGEIDTVLQLYASDGASLLDENDDWNAEGQGSRIVWTAPEDGWYYARVTHFDSTHDPRYALACGNHYLIAVESSACTTALDATEPDNLYEDAATIVPGGGPLTRTFHVMADKDWVRFHALKGYAYTVRTFGLTTDVDTVLQLYASDGVTLIEENDDWSTDGKGSRIAWTAPADGWYYARVTHFDSTYDPRRSDLCGNYYQIEVQTNACTIEPDPEEPNDLYTQAAEMGTDGIPVERTFHKISDKDWYTFHAWEGQFYTITTSHLSPQLDTVLELYDTDGTTLLYENDDYRSGSRGSNAGWVAPATGWYYVRVTNLDATYDPRLAAGCESHYRLAIKEQILAAHKSVYAPRHLKPGDEIVYTIVITNLMNTVQTGVVITDPVPLHTSYVTGSATLSQGEVVAGDPLIFRLGDLAPQQRVTLSFRVILRESGRGKIIENRAIVASDQQVMPLNTSLVRTPVYYYVYIPSSQRE